MKPTKIQVSILINSISDKFNDVVKSGLKGIDKYEFQLPFFIPKVHRPNFEELTESEQSEFVALQDSVGERLAEWLDYQFPAIMAVGTASRIASHVVSYVHYCCPHFSPSSNQFETLVKATALPLLVDFFADNKELFVNSGFEDLDINNGIEIMAEVMEQTNGFTCFDEDMKRKMFQLEKLHSNRFSAMLGGATLDFLDTFKDLNENSLAQYSWYFKQLFTTASVGFIMKKNEIDSCSINTHRYFRSMEGTILPMVGLAVLLKEANVSIKVSENLLFLRFKKVVDEISAGFNDILGLQKDIQNGEGTGTVFFKLKNGTPLETILDEEILILKDNIDDYPKLRAMLLEKFPEDENLEMYIEITDSALFGLFQVFADSEVYGMKR